MLELFSVSCGDLTPHVAIRGPHSDSAPGELFPLYPLVTPQDTRSPVLSDCIFPT